jgi:hypothetical protein
MPNDFNPLSTGLADAISRYSGRIQNAVKVCQPFNDFEKRVNKDMLDAVRLYSQAMLDLVFEHQKIHDMYLLRKNEKC